VTLYRVTAEAIVNTDYGDDNFCEIERASMLGLAAITSRDVVRWTVEKVED
jgi:hypothetical protein